MEGRPWELWDRPNVAQWIDQYWRSEGEIRHRKELLKVVAKRLREHNRFLEVGCGSGHVYRYLSELVRLQYVGVDSSEEMLGIARQSFPGVDFRKGDGYGLRFPDGSFDAVAAIDVLQHVPDIIGIVREMLRVSGSLVFFTLSEAPATVSGEEEILGNKFLWNRYSPEDARAKVASTAGGAAAIETVSVEAGARLWILSKNSGAGPPGRFLFASDIESAVTEGECRRLAELAEGKRVLEIGSWLGRSTIAMASRAVVVHSVDWHKGDPHTGEADTLGPFVENLGRHGVRDRVVVHVGDIVEKIKEFAPASFDMAFVDAYHEKSAVARDIRLVLPLIRLGGVLAFHDYGYRVMGRNGIPLGVTEAVDEFLKGSGLALERVESLAIVWLPEAR